MTRAGTSRKASPTWRTARRHVTLRGTKGESNLSLAGKKVFFVEDEALIALSLEDLLTDLGCDVVARAMTIAAALPMAREAVFDVAVLDVNVAGHRIDPVADALALRGVPFLFTTGYGRGSLPERHRHSIMVAKPYVVGDLQWALLEALRAASAPAAIS